LGLSQKRRRRHNPELAHSELRIAETRRGITFRRNADQPHAEMANETSAEPHITQDSAYQGFALAQNLESGEQVDEIFARLASNRAKIMNTKSNALAAMTYCLTKRK
jgi:hypothetical protein